MLSADSSSTTVADWTYIAEGGDTMVLAYTGRPHPDLDRTVLRLKKRRRQPTMLPDGSGPYAPEPVADDNFTLRYQHEIIERLLPTKLLPRYGTAHVTPQWLASVDDAMEARRPAQRLIDDSISLKQARGLLATNLIAGNGVVVELKPKWGFLPSPMFLSEDTRDKKLDHCRQCMHTQFKRKHGETVAEGFCPLDLYSGDPRRVRSAIARLWDTWKASDDDAIRNLRVFFDGKTADPRDPGTVERVSQWLLKQSAGSQSVEDAFATMVMERLKTSSVLSVLSNLQRRLDVLDIEGLAKLASQGNQELGSRKEVTLDQWSAFVREYEGPARYYNHACPDVAHLQFYRLAYLLSATFKDCSIMINLDDTLVEGRVAIIDLDPKPPKKFGKWEALDRRIVLEYECENPHRRCVDSLAPDAAGQRLGGNREPPVPAGGDSDGLRRSNEGYSCAIN